MTASAHTFTVDGITYTPPSAAHQFHMRRPMIQLFDQFTAADGWQWSPSLPHCEVCWLRYGRARVCMCYSGGGE